MTCQLTTLLRAAAFGLAVWMTSTTGLAAEQVKVFPVRAFFYDTGLDSKLDPAFHSLIAQLSAPTLGTLIHEKLTTAFGSRVENSLTASNAGSTLAVSFHATRASSFFVDKGNGNSDVVASVTAGLYFTNVVTGEILSTLSRSVTSRSVVTKQTDMTREKSRLFQQALESVINGLVSEGEKQFNPIVVETKLIDRVGELMVFDTGYTNGIQIGDQIEDGSDNLVRIIYVSDKYSVGQTVLASNLNIGTKFKKFLAHAASGKDRPRVAILIENPPSGFAKDYLARLFGEILGDSAPLTLVQINTGFSQLMSAIRQQDRVNLSLMRSSERRPPGLVIRLRVAEPITYEAGTSASYQKIRRYETLAFADVIDTSGRIIYSAMGKDVIKDKIVNNIGVGAQERSEVNIKNALTDLAHKLARIGDLKREQAEVANVTGLDLKVTSQGKVYGDRQPGIVLKKVKVKADGGTINILLPIAEAYVLNHAGQAITPIKQLLAIDASSPSVAIGDVFETSRMGTAPKSAGSFSLCGPLETLGNMTTPSLLSLSGYYMGQKMPGMFYAPDAPMLAEGIIGAGSGFTGPIKWNIPPINYCVQVVDRVTLEDEVCSNQCERSISSRYTFRLKSGENILARVAFEGKFKSAGYFKSTETQHLKVIFEADVVDEAQRLLEMAADKVSLPHQ